MANGWLNQWGTNLGNMLLQQQNPYADSSKMTPEQWRSGVSGGLLSLAGGIGQFGNQAPLGALGSAFNQLGQQGQERGLNLMRARVLQSEVSEKERDARLREQLTRQLFPDMAGVEAAPAGAPATQAPQMPVGAPMAPPVSGATAQANRAPAAMPSGQPEAAAPQDLDAAFIEQFGPEHFQKVKAMSPATPIKEIYQRLYPEDPGAAVNATLRNPTLRNMTLGQWIGDVERRSGQGALPATATTQSAPDNTARLQQLRKALFIAPASMREGIKAEIDALQSKPTDDLREYAIARQQGYPGTFLDYQKELKAAAATKIDIGQKGEDAFEKKAGEKQAERFNELAAAGQGADAQMTQLQSLTDIASRIQTGKGAQLTALLGPYAQALGVNVAGLGDLEAYEAIATQLAPSLRVPGTGTMSDRDLAAFMKSIPSLARTPEGNRLVQNTLSAIFQQKKAAAEISSRALLPKDDPDHISRGQAEKMLRQMPNPFGDYLKQKSGKSQFTPDQIEAELRRRGLR